MVTHCFSLCARDPTEPTTGTHTNLKQGRSSRPRAIFCTVPLVWAHVGLGIYFMRYNFVRIHQTLKITPAMAAGGASKL